MNISYGCGTSFLINFVAAFVIIEQTTSHDHGKKGQIQVL
jgi:hypothetical protein